MRPRAAPGADSLHGVGQLRRCLESLHIALFNNRPGDAARPALAAQFPKNLRQLPGLEFVHQLRGAHRLPPVHPHVQRPLGLKTETALRLVELRRAHPEIQQHPVATRLGQALGQAGKRLPVQLQPAAKPFQAPGRGGQRPIVAVEPHQPPVRAARLEDRLRMSAAADRAIHVQPARRRLKRRERFLQQNRFVDEFGHKSSAFS